MAALVFGSVGWFWMRESVVAVTNDVDTPGAVGPMDRTVSLYPDLGFVYYLRGERHFANRDFPPALNDLNHSIDLDPRFAAAYLARARLIGLGRDREQALADVNHVIDLRPDHPGAYGVRGLINLFDRATANVDFERALAPLPRDARGWDAYSVRCIAAESLRRGSRQSTSVLVQLKLIRDGREVTTHAPMPI